MNANNGANGGSPVREGTGLESQQSTLGEERAALEVCKSLVYCATNLRYHGKLIALLIRYAFTFVAWVGWG